MVVLLIIGGKSELLSHKKRLNNLCKSCCTAQRRRNEAAGAAEAVQQPIAEGGVELQELNVQVLDVHVLDDSSESSSDTDEHAAVSDASVATSRHQLQRHVSQLMTTEDQIDDEVVLLRNVADQLIAAAIEEQRVGDENDVFPRRASLSSCSSTTSTFTMDEEQRGSPTRRRAFSVAMTEEGDQYFFDNETEETYWALPDDAQLVSLESEPPAQGQTEEQLN
jgi:hypothetical protein